jgi:hypothetical protein
MKALMLIVAITVVAFVIAGYVIGAINPGGLHPTNWTDAQLIRDRCHVRLIQPEWVSSNGSVLMNWIIAETKARLAVVAIFWVAGLSFIARYEMSENENAK